jgi:hypothetical protein
MTGLRRGLTAIVWLVAVVVIALGAAGLVTGMDAPPTSGGRSELTERGDAIVTPALDAAEADLQQLADDVAALGVASRGALAALNGSDLETVDAAIAEGDELVASIRDRSAGLRAALAATPLIGTPEADFEVSARVQERHRRLVEALGATGDLDGAWARLTIGSVAASRLSARLADHDTAVLKAAGQGRDADYDNAVETLDDAEAAITEARTLRNRLAATVDVTVLDQWLDRNAAYDTALRDLYLALRDVGGRVTDKVRDAIAAEKAAKARLPPDARGLIVIMSEIGRGGMNSAVITIEEARGRLAEALADVTPSAGPDDGATPAPTTPG